MNPSALLLPAVPLVLAALGWWGAGSLTAKMVKPQPAPSVPTITLPAGIEALAPAGPRPPLGLLELAAFGFTSLPKPVVVARPKIPTAVDLYVVDSVLQGSVRATATIGNQTVVVGDLLDKRYQVLVITADGVVVRGLKKNDKPERIGFRPFVAVTAPTSGTSVPAPITLGVPPGSAAPTMPSGSPQGLRDFRQILETLKL